MRNATKPGLHTKIRSFDTEREASYAFAVARDSGAKVIYCQHVRGLRFRAVVRDGETRFAFCWKEKG